VRVHKHVARLTLTRVGQPDGAEFPTRRIRSELGHELQRFVAALGANAPVEADFRERARRALGTSASLPEAVGPLPLDFRNCHGATATSSL